MVFTPISDQEDNDLPRRALVRVRPQPLRPSSKGTKAKADDQPEQSTKPNETESDLFHGGVVTQ